MGVATSAAYFFIFRDWQLYGSTYLQVWFVLVSLIGTVFWRGQLLGKERASSETSSLLTRLLGIEVVPTAFGSRSYILKTILVTLVAAVPMYFVLQEFNDASPRWDGLIAVGSVAAIWLQAKKYVQSWYLWIGVDLVAIPLYYSQGNGGTALLYVLYMLMCFFGLYTWRQQAVANAKPVYLPNDSVIRHGGYTFLSPNTTDEEVASFISDVDMLFAKYGDHRN